MKERLKITPHYTDLDRLGERVVEVEYVPTDHYSPEMIYREGTLKSYLVLVDGEEVGQVTQEETTSSTTYSGTRIRRDLGHPVEWGWRNKVTGETNSPGLLCQTRRSSVGELLGFGRYCKVERVTV